MVKSLSLGIIGNQAQPLAQGVVKPALLDQLDKEAELAQPQAQTTHPSSPATH